MQELLMTTNKRRTVAGKPAMGFNFDTGKSTGNTTISVSNATDVRDISTLPAIDGYKKAVWITTGSKITPVAPLNVGTGDFTLELVVLTSNAQSGYNFFFYAEVSGTPRMEIRLADNGYGNRLQVSLNPNTASDVYPCSTTRAQFINAWHHIAFVREKGKIRMYLDGVQQALAVGTGTAYSTDRTDARSIDTISNVQLGHPQYPGNCLIPEFAFYQGVKYNKNFTPAYPLVA